MMKILYILSELWSWSQSGSDSNFTFAFQFPITSKSGLTIPNICRFETVFFSFLDQIEKKLDIWQTWYMYLIMKKYKTLKKNVEKKVRSLYIYVASRLSTIIQRFSKTVPNGKNSSSFFKKNRSQCCFFYSDWNKKCLLHDARGV